MIETKLCEIAEAYGQPPEELAEQGVYDSICPSICTNMGCNYTADLEPDQHEGYCENCNTHSVQSILVLMNLI